MKKIIINIILILTSILPLKLLYFIAYITRLVNQVSLKYRLDIIQKNINAAFPSLNEQQINNLTSAFYVEFTDTIFEIIKSASFNKHDILNRVRIKNEVIIEKSLHNKKPIVLMCGHYSNLEWLGLRLSLIPNMNFSAVYKPFSNGIISNFLKKIRTKFGAKLVTLEKWKYFILKNKDKPYAFMFVADQVPNNESEGVRMNFLNQSTLFHTGPEKTASLLNTEVFYVEIEKIKKGYYTIEFKKIKSKNITQEYAVLLENTIKKNPASWLWSHNRWKR